MLPCCALLAAAQEQPPGRGVLCLGTFVYFAERVGTTCRAGQDAAFQKRVADHARRFDEYIVRNTGGDPAKLAQFKKSQNVDSAGSKFLCQGDVAASYDKMKRQDPASLDKAVDDLLARDGPPTFGDCV